MNNNHDPNINIQQDAFKNIQANSFSVGSIVQKVQNFPNFQQSNISSRSQLLNYLKGQVECWKEDYLYNNEWLQPLLQQRNELVTPSNSKEKGIPGKSHSQQFLQISIKDFFKKEKITGRLLILGNPGAGKTAAKMQIAEELIICAENNYSEPIPFWFDLSSWNEQSLEKWLIVELKNEYGVDPKIGHKLLKNYQILPMLDNLDQLKLPHQLKCITAINNFLKKDKLIPLIVCCRFEGYNQFYQLALNGAVYLQPLSEEQVQNYCKNVNNFELLRLVDNDSNLLNFVKTPFFLYLINFTYESINIEKWRKLNSDKRRIYYLFDIFIEKNNQDAQSHAKGWYQLQMIYKTKARLAWLAKKLKEHSSTYFLIENIQPSWLENENQKVRYRLFVGLMIALFSFPISIVISAFILMAFGKAEESIVEAIRDVMSIPPLVISFIASVILAVTIDFIGLNKEIKPVETLKLPFHELIETVRLAQIKERVVTSIFLSLTQRIPVNESNKQLIQFIQEWIYSILGWIIKGIVGWFIPPVALLRGILIGLTGPNIDIKKRAVPNQGIYKSLINTVPFASIFGLLGCFFGFSFKLYEVYSINGSLKDIFHAKNISFSIFFASLGVLLGIIYTCLPVVQHYALRLVLIQDDLVPTNFAEFLEHTNKYRLTQRYGGRYSFIHDLWRDYFANLRLNEGNQEQARK